MTDWRPIETAPKDGTEVLLYAPGRVTYGAWSKPSETPQIKYRDGFAPEPEYEDFEPYWASWDGGFTDERPPTHWMPRPQPPGEPAPTLEHAYAEGRADEREDMRTLLQQTRCIRAGWHPFTALALQHELLAALAADLRLSDGLAGTHDAGMQRTEMDTTVGTCGNCGGPVKVPAAWYATIPPTPTCTHCGATARMNHGPVLPMEQPKRLAPGVDELWNGKLPPAG